ncbi:hypothetical protein T484DRAFT_1931318 [Baffinella frigidus]|nr:hypothetical protein T484DRAFT_1931318 [Cryptophyta sp. CCMP2293]
MDKCLSPPLDWCQQSCGHFPTPPLSLISATPHFRSFPYSPTLSVLPHFHYPPPVCSPVTPWSVASS